MTTTRHRHAGPAAKGAGLRFEVVFAGAASRDRLRLIAELKSMLKEHRLGPVTVGSLPHRQTPHLRSLQLNSVVKPGL